LGIGTKGINYRSCTGRSSEKLYVAAVEALKKKERQDETQETIKMYISIRGSGYPDVTEFSNV
jgi:hypothetical protein